MFLKGTTTKYHVILHRSSLLFGLHTSFSLFAFGMYAIYAAYTFSSDRESKIFNSSRETFCVSSFSSLRVWSKMFFENVNKICDFFSHNGNFVFIKLPHLIMFSCVVSVAWFYLSRAPFSNSINLPCSLSLSSACSLACSCNCDQNDAKAGNWKCKRCKESTTRAGKLMFLESSCHRRRPNFTC